MERETEIKRVRKMDECGKEGERQRDKKDRQGAKRGRWKEWKARGRGDLSCRLWSRREARCVMQPSGDSRNKLGCEMRERRSCSIASFASFSASGLTCV